MAKLLQYGAGNIGRSLVAQLFSKAGYEVVFVDIDDNIIQALNQRRRYLIQVKDKRQEDIWVENVRGVNGRDRNQVLSEIETADIMATAVGVNALPNIYEIIAEGIKRRSKPINIIICENLRHMSRIFKENLMKYLPEGFPINERVGLVETAIGKMVPIMPEEIRKEDPLLVWTEAYNTIYVDKDGFIGEIPQIEGIVPKSNFSAYVDQKLFIHNLGHAITAYMGFIIDPENNEIWKAINNETVSGIVEAAMWESAQALIAEYPSEFNRKNQKDYIEDLIKRFGNNHLGDTIYRVGRDLRRKLGHDERLIGAGLLDLKHNIMPRYTALGIAAAFMFQATDENGNMFEGDKLFIEEFKKHGLFYMLKEVSGLNPNIREHKNLMLLIDHAYSLLSHWDKNLYKRINLQTQKPA